VDPAPALGLAAGGCPDRPARQRPAGITMIYVLPLIFILVGFALYGVLGGADFGAGFWQLTAGKGALAERVRERPHHSMAPGWTAPRFSSECSRWRRGRIWRRCF